MQGVRKCPSIPVYLGVFFKGKDSCGTSIIDYEALIVFEMTTIFLLPQQNVLWTPLWPVFRFEADHRMKRAWPCYSVPHAPV